MALFFGILLNKLIIKCKQSQKKQMNSWLRFLWRCRLWGPGNRTDCQAFSRVSSIWNNIIVDNHYDLMITVKLILVDMQGFPCHKPQPKLVTVAGAETWAVANVIYIHTYACTIWHRKTCWYDCLSTYCGTTNQPIHQLAWLLDWQRNVGRTCKLSKSTLMFSVFILRNKSISIKYSKFVKLVQIYENCIISIQQIMNGSRAIYLCR